MLVVSGLDKHYDGDCIFENFACQLPAGRYWLQGSNGSGKSTLLRVFAQLEVVQRGSFNWHNQPIHPAWARQHVAISADAIEFPGFLTLETLCQYWQAQYPDAVLAPLIEGFQLTAVLPREWRYVSVGQRKKLSLALALSRPCTLLLLDEPANGLDVEALDFLQTVLQTHPAALQIVASHQQLPWLVSARRLGVSKSTLAFQSGHGE